MIRERPNAPWAVRDLTEVGLDRWFEIDRTPPGPTEIARLRALMTPDETVRPFRSVLLDAEGRVRARIGGYLAKNGRLTFWAPRHAAGSDVSARRCAAHRLVEHCVTQAQGIPCARYLETKPAHDTPDLEAFLGALRDEGFEEVAAAHLHVLDLDASAPETASDASGHGPSSAPELRIIPAHTLPPNALDRLFDACQEGTLDRAQVDSPASAQETLEELRRFAGAAADTELWSVAYIDDEPVGFALCGASGDLESAPEDVALIELGVISEHRRAHIGLRLVSAMLEALRHRGATTVEALVDDQNLPSLCLHRSLGFMRQPGVYLTWRRRLDPAH